MAIVLHTMGGTLAGTDAWFHTPTSHVSAHTGIGLGGETHHYVHYANRAWANGVLETGNLWTPHFGNLNPNNYTLSIETEDAGDPSMPVDEAEYEAVLAEARCMLGVYPTLKWLVPHSAISPRTRPHCPGDRWVRSGKFAELASALDLAVLGGGQ